MRNPFLRPASEKIAVQRFHLEDRTVALLRVGGTLRTRILSRLTANYAAEGDYVKQGGAIAPSAMLSLLAAGTGATLTSTLFANSLFVATANPATLMAIGNGVGSAVMGATGIAGQAAFVPAGAAMMPVVAPLVAFQAMSTVLILNSLHKISAQLDDLKRTLDRVIQRSEATHIGGLISADHRLREIEDDFVRCNRFTPSMLTRLALIEAQVNPTFERYLFLLGQSPEATTAKADDFDYRRLDSYLMVESSLLDLRIDVLRLRLAAQEEIGIAVKARDRLLEKIGRYSRLWDEISREPREVAQAAGKVKEAADALGMWRRNLPSWLGGDRETRKRQEAQAETMKSASHQAALHTAPRAAQAKSAAAEVAATLDTPEVVPVSLIYWRDESGEYSFYTTDLEIQPAPASKRRSTDRKAIKSAPRKGVGKLRKRAGRA